MPVLKSCLFLFTVQKDSGAISDSEAFTKRRSQGKSISFDDSRNEENIHSEAEMFDIHEAPMSREAAGRTLQEVALESITSDLNYQPQLKPRRPIWEMQNERPVNSNRGYRPQKRHGSSTGGSSSQYADSALSGGKSYGDSHGKYTDSEAEADTEDINQDMSMDTSRDHSLPRGMPGLPHTSYHTGAYIKDPPKHSTPYGTQNKENRQHPSAFSPISPGKRVKIVEGKKRRKRRRDKPPSITEPGAVDFSQYDLTAKIWMEQVDPKTVQKSETMKFAILPEGVAPPAKISSQLSYEMTSDDVFLPPQWVIARGRSLRKHKKHLSSTSSLRRTPTSGMFSDSDYEMSDRPMSPGRQLILFFKVGSNWKDLAWVLFEGILNDSETIRMIKDIQLKHPGKLTEQVHDLMRRWWAKKGESATIEELQIAMDIINLGYIREEHLEGRGATSVTTFTDTEDDLDISEVDEADPDVSRLITQYDVRSLNNSFDWDAVPENRGGIPGSAGLPPIDPEHSFQRNASHSGSIGGYPGLDMSRDGSFNTSRGRLDMSTSSLHSGRKSPISYAHGRRSPYGSGRKSPAPSGHGSFRYSQDDLLDEDGRQRFLIVQPQLKPSDVSDVISCRVIRNSHLLPCLPHAIILH